MELLEPLPAVVARKLGSLLLTRAMESRPEIGLSSYDRLFPSQDTLPQGGFGNLIALPLQRRARDLANAVFVDEGFLPHEDQFGYLSSLQRLARERVESLVAEAEAQDQVMGVRVVPEEDWTDEPWRRLEIAPSRLAAKQTTLHEGLPASLRVVLADQLYVPKDELTPALCNCVIRLAAFQNPEFYRAQAMHPPVFGQSLSRQGRVDELVTDYGQVIVDECHHLPAGTFEQVARAAKARYFVGLSATPTRKDGHHPILFMQCGPIRYRSDPRRQAAERPFEHRAIVRPTRFVLQPPGGPDAASTADPSIQELYSLLAADHQRNALIVEDVIRAVRAGRSPVVLTERREHLETLADLLRPEVANVILLHGGLGAKKRREIVQRLTAIEASEERVLVATGRYLGEGFDDARLDTLFLALPISWRGTLAQYAGRLHRLDEGKTEVIVYDYADLAVPVLARMHERRLRGYRAMGYEVSQAATASP